jgi:hypothetical protein
MDADAKLKRSLALTCQLPLENHRTIDRLHGTSKLRENTIACRVSNPALVQFDLLLSCVSNFSKSSESCRLDCMSFE